jgi:hypothetical protein
MYAPVLGGYLTFEITVASDGIGFGQGSFSLRNCLGIGCLNMRWSGIMSQVQRFGHLSLVKLQHVHALTNTCPK